MPPSTAKTLMKDFRASFRRKKATDSTPKIDKAKELEDEEYDKLVELKRNMKDEIIARYSDFDLMGFLHAKSMNVAEAEKLLKLDMNLRLFLQLNEFIRHYEPTELESKYSVSGIVGPDKDGYPVRVINVGYSDIKGFVHSLSTIENFKSFIWFLEKDRLTQFTGNNKNSKERFQMSYILNMENITMGKITYKPVIDTAFTALKLLQEHYHDVVKVVYVINSPSFFSSAWKLFKPAIQDSLHQKIKILGSEWKTELLKSIDADNLPVYYGGNRLDVNGDPQCREFISWGGQIPDKFYPDDFLSPDDPDVTCATVPANTFLNFRFTVPEKGCIVQYHIQSKDNDIGIGIFLEKFPSDPNPDNDTEKEMKKKSEDDMSHWEPLTPVARCQCQICPEIGSTVSWFSGTVILHFDNTYSWMSSKEVMFKVNIYPPE